MATNSILDGGQAAPRRARGRDIDALGPSDSSDSGSDVHGERPMPTLPDNPGELGALPVESGSDTDASGTGERGSATGVEPRDAADISPDRIGAGPSSPPTAETPLASDADDSPDLADDLENDAGESPRTPASEGVGGPTGRVRRVRAADAARAASDRPGKPRGSK